MYHNYDRRSSSSFQNELSIRSENVQRIYNFYANQRFYVNRRYQRKLVWTIEEKKAFIDSILQGFPVPIILLAETERDHESVYEIIDGMQRLNAVISFIEGEFDIPRDAISQAKYFDLQTMVESKSLLDQGKLQQKKPLLDRTECEIIASYVLPLSVYQFNDNEKVDDFKQGFTRLDGKKEFDTASFNKMIKTLTAMANHAPGSTGYVCVGVADIDILSALKRLRFRRVTRSVSDSFPFGFFATASIYLRGLLSRLLNFGLTLAPQTLGLCLPASPAVFN